ncbi:uncharacterized protein [Asterias amurensis]|uniref:uncharacterized protein n=1 Tax=Asterias amurensis TaxID=7602 RepID=UPI003AB299E2
MTSTGHRLRSLAHKHLKEKECASLKQAIQSFRETKSVLTLCTTLKGILTTKEKLSLLVAIYPMIPADHQEDFDRLCCLHFDMYQLHIRPQILERYGAPAAQRNTTALTALGRQKRKSARVLLPVEQLRNAMSLEARGKATSEAHHRVKQKAGDSSRRADVIRVRRDSSRSSEGRKEHKRSRTVEADVGRGDGQQPQVPPLSLNASNEREEEATTPRGAPSSVRIRKIKLDHRENESLGFCIRGGKDLNAGIYVSEVDAGGQADRHGLKVGERVLKVNDLPFKNITHAQAVVALKSSRRLTLYVAPLGVMPGSTPNGTPRSEMSSARSTSSQHSAKSTASSRHGKGSQDNNKDEGALSKVKQVTIIADDDGWLGCSIRGGIDYEMDVTVANVDPMSPAYRSGLKKGQYINKVNGVSVAALTHDEIVSLVTASNVIMLDIGPAPKKAPPVPKEKPKNHRRSQTAEAVLSNQRPAGKPPKNMTIPQSPKHTGRLAANFAEFELELQSTPPVSTSTPLPPDNHPALIANRGNHRENLPPQDEEELRASSPDPDGRFVTILHDSDELDDSILMNTPRDNAAASKFDMGTIRLNLANRADKIPDKGKLMNNNLGECGRTPTKRDHVKDIFHLNGNVEEYRTPVSSPKPNRNSISGLNTPEKNPYIKASMNILSSPYNNVEQEIRLANYRPSTPSKQLPIMKPLVSSQLHHELTGKRAKPPICPNIPVAQTSPVSKFFKKMLRRNSGSSRKGTSQSGSSLRSCSSVESLNEDRMSLNSLGASSGGGAAMHRSAYDLMVENDGDVTLL